MRKSRNETFAEHGGQTEPTCPVAKGILNLDNSIKSSETMRLEATVLGVVYSVSSHWDSCFLCRIRENRTLALFCDKEYDRRQPDEEFRYNGS